MTSVQATNFNTVQSRDKTMQKNVQEKKSNKSMSTSTKVMIGAGAVAALVIGGLLYHNSAMTKKAEEAARRTAEKLKNMKTHKSDNAGETVAQTIENILGKDSAIKPHTYDTAREFHTIPCYRDQGGYKDGLVTKAGIVDDINENIPDINLLSSAICHKQHLENVCRHDGINIYKGVVEGSTNKMVRFEMNDPSGGGGRQVIFSIISPNREYTPLQKDLLKLAESPEKIDTSVFDRIFKFKNDVRDGKRISREDIVKYCGKYENLDYDLILSAIQSMAHKV